MNKTSSAALNSSVRLIVVITGVAFVVMVILAIAGVLARSLSPRC